MSATASIPVPMTREQLIASGRGVVMLCPRCFKEIGRDLGNRVRIGRVFVFQRVVLTCECGYKRQFRPSANPSPGAGEKSASPAN